jgi:hypothetical protein
MKNSGLRRLVVFIRPPRFGCSPARGLPAAETPSGAPNIDNRGIHRVLDMRRVEIFDHLNTRAAVLGDLINVRSLHEPQADVGMPQAVKGSALGIAVELKVKLAEDGIE